MAEHYAPQLNLLTQLANYTSNLIPRAFQSSEKKFRDVIVCFTLLKQMGVMLDAIDVLTRAGAVTAAYLPARTAFEASLYLEWILVADGERKAAHYYVGQVRKERVWGRRATNGTPESSAFVGEMHQLREDLYRDREDLETQGRQLVLEADRILRQPLLADANEAFELYMRRKRGSFEPDWYKVLGTPSVRAIAKELMRLPDYIIYYGKGSEVAHSSSMEDHVRFKNKGAVAHPIRNLAGAHRLFNFAFSNALHTFIRVLQFYRSWEMPAYGALYLTEWRSAFLNIPKINVEPAPLAPP